MTLSISVPSKTFLMGEYLVLAGGPALLLSTSPRFRLTVNNGRDTDKNNYLNLSEKSPAMSYMKSNLDFFKKFNLSFSDPYHGLGGFGASSAQFALLYLLKAYYEKHMEIDFHELLTTYKEYAWDGIGAAPSGADVISQVNGSVTYFENNSHRIEKYIWPFSELLFCVIHTRHKITTHEHLKTLSNFNIDQSTSIVKLGLESLAKHNASNFIESIHAYHQLMIEQKLIADHTLKLLKVVNTLPGVLAAKGCGALGADVILTLLDKSYLEKFIFAAEAKDLEIINIGCHADEGFYIEQDKNIDNQVILVDNKDQQLDIAEKLFAHERGILHRAFSVFIFRKNEDKTEVLLQQRASHKYHCGGLWSNTCCSHPRPGEDVLVGAHLRLQDEMGIDTTLHEVGSFRYKAYLENGLIEHEIDHVFVGDYNQNAVQPNPDEVDNYRWLTLEAFEQDMKENPKKYTPWLQQAFHLIIQKNALNEYLHYQ